MLHLVPYVNRRVSQVLHKHYAVIIHTSLLGTIRIKYKSVRLILPSFIATLKSEGSSTDTRISPAAFDSSWTNSSELKILWRASSSSSCSSISAFISPVPEHSQTSLLLRTFCEVAFFLENNLNSCLSCWRWIWLRRLEWPVYSSLFVNAFPVDGCPASGDSSVNDARLRIKQERQPMALLLLHQQVDIHGTFTVITLNSVDDVNIWVTHPNKHNKEIEKNRGKVI